MAVQHDGGGNDMPIRNWKHAVLVSVAIFVAGILYAGAVIAAYNATHKAPPRSADAR